jgi:uncharacterized protein YqgC (DUF456 family)
MDTLWAIIGSILLLAGLAGCILPFLPGPPLCFAALLLLQLRAAPPFTEKFLWIWGVITVVVTVLDYIIPIYGAKKYGGSRYGLWGCTLGLIAGMLIPPWGLVIGPFIGAFIGEVMASQSTHLALRAAFGSFIGFLVGTLLKVIACVVMMYYFIKGIW